MKKIVMLLLVAILAISVIAPAFAETCSKVGCNKILNWEIASTETKTEDTPTGYWKWTRTTYVYRCPNGHVASTSVKDSERVFDSTIYIEPGPYIF